MKKVIALVFIIVAVAGCQKQASEEARPGFSEASLPQEASDEEAGFGGKMTPKKSSGGLKDNEEVGEPAAEPAVVESADRADEAPKLQQVGASGKSARTKEKTKCDAGCKKVCERFSHVHAACATAYAAGCFEKPRVVSEAKCKLPEASTKRSDIAADSDTIAKPAAAEQKKDPGALPELFGDL